MNFVALVVTILLGLFVLTVIAVMLFGAWTLLRGLVDRRRSRKQSEP